MGGNPYDDAVEQIAKIDARLAERAAANEKDMAERSDWQAVQRLYADKYAGGSKPDTGVDKDRRLSNVSYRSGSVKHLIVEALSIVDKPWLDAAAVQQLTSTLKGAMIPMTTISPSLSDMKDKGVIVRDGSKVALAQRAGEQPSYPDGRVFASEADKTM